MRVINKNRDRMSYFTYQRTVSIFSASFWFYALFGSTMWQQVYMRIEYSSIKYHDEINASDKSDEWLK